MQLRTESRSASQPMHLIQLNTLASANQYRNQSSS
jgi:hypothetical protein